MAIPGTAPGGTAATAGTARGMILGTIPGTTRGITVTMAGVATTDGIRLGITAGTRPGTTEACIQCGFIAASGRTMVPDILRMEQPAHRLTAT